MILLVAFSLLRVFSCLRFVGVADPMGAEVEMQFGEMEEVEIGQQETPIFS